MKDTAPKGKPPPEAAALEPTEAIEPARPLCLGTTAPRGAVGPTVSVREAKALY
jgi:hypothetical protein